MPTTVIGTNFSDIYDLYYEQKDLNDAKLKEIVKKKVMYMHAYKYISYHMYMYVYIYIYNIKHGAFLLMWNACTSFVT